MDANAGSSKLATVVRVTSGNFLEMFDFFLFGFYASHIAHAFFPSDNEITSLLFTFMTFGAGFLMRPLGAIVLGAYFDRHGRRQGLITTLMLMAAGTILIAFFIGCLIVPFLFVRRRSLEETPEFLARKHRPSAGEIARSMVENWRIVLAG